MGMHELMLMLSLHTLWIVERILDDLMLRTNTILFFMIFETFLECNPTPLFYPG